MKGKLIIIYKHGKNGILDLSVILGDHHQDNTEMVQPFWRHRRKNIMKERAKIPERKTNFNFFNVSLGMFLILFVELECFTIFLLVGGVIMTNDH